MIIRRMSCVVFAGFLVCFAAQGGGEEAVKKEMKKLQGEWKMTSLKLENGTELVQAGDEKFKMTIKDNKFKVTDGEKVVAEGTYKIVEMKGKIRKSDLDYTKPDTASGKTVPQLAEWVDEETFRVAIPNFNALKRPTDFEPKQGQNVLIFKRGKK